MEKKCVALFDGSEDYVNKFLDYCSEKKDLGFEVAGFYRLDDLERYLQTAQVDVLLFSMEDAVEAEKSEEERYEPILAHPRVKEAVYLGERRNSKSRMRHIDKYRSMEAILRNLRKVLFSEEEANALRQAETSKRKKRLFCVYGKAEEETSAHFLLEEARQLAQGAKVLVVDLERFGMLSDLLGSKENNLLSELLFFYKTDRSRIGDALQKVVRYQSVDFLFAPSAYEDLEEIAESEWLSFLHTLSQCGGCDVLLLRMGEAFRNLELFFDAAETVFLLPAAGKSGARQTKRLLRGLSQKGREDLFSKMQVLTRNKEEASGRNEEENPWIWQKN